MLQCRFSRGPLAQFVLASPTSVDAPAYPRAGRNPNRFSPSPGHLAPVPLPESRQTRTRRSDAGMAADTRLHFQAISAPPRTSRTRGSKTHQVRANTITSRHLPCCCYSYVNGCAIEEALVSISRRWFHDTPNIYLLVAVVLLLTMPSPSTTLM